MEKSIKSEKLKNSCHTLLFLTFSLMLILFSSCQQTTEKKSAEPKITPDDKRPNIVLIMTDQHQAEALSIAGNLNVSTPNLDKLAQSGVRFENAYVTFPLCIPSRSSMFTGQMPHQLGINSNVDTKMKPEAINKNIAHVLKSNGYDCAYGGKWHAPEVEIESESGFDKISEFGDLDLAENSIAYMKSRANSNTPFFFSGIL